MSKFIDEFGLARVWQNIKTYITNNSGVGVTMDQVNTAIQEALKDYVKKPDESTFSWWSPTMTSNTTPTPFSCSASTIYSDQYDVWMAFDGNFSTFFHSLSNKNAENTEWLMFDFGSETIVQGIRMSSRQGFPGYYPQCFTIKHSVDGVNFSTIQSYKDLSSPEYGNYSEYIFTPSIKCRYLKIDDMKPISVDRGYYNIAISEIEFFKC